MAKKKDDKPKITIERHIFVGSKASWETIPDDAPQYDELPSIPLSG